MTESTGAEADTAHLPMAFFMGDFNVGKSALINALLRREALWATREESRALPTFVARSAQREARYAALARANQAVEVKGHEEFLDIRREPGQEDLPYRALAAALPASPFTRLVMVDTPGISSDACESVRVTQLAGQEQALVAVVADIEYWSAKHTMDFIAFHHDVFGDSLIVVANKADHLNADEIRRICAHAPARLEEYGISPAPSFFAVSARLESARGLLHNEYRRRVKPEVRELCDAGFDALRVALYEFESRFTDESACRSFRQLLEAPLAASFIAIQEGPSQ